MISKYLLPLAAIVGILLSCGPAYHLRKAEEKGAKVTTDTVFTDVITERTITDTLVHFQTVREILAGNPIITETTRWRSVTKIDTLTKTIYQQVECKPDTIRVPVSVSATISAGYTKWQLGGSVLGALLFAGLMAYAAYRLAGVVRKGNS